MHAPNYSATRSRDGAAPYGERPLGSKVERCADFQGLTPALVPPGIEAISPRLEMGAYEALWLDKEATFKRIADRFRATPVALPSTFVDQATAEAKYQEAAAALAKAGVNRFGIRINGAGDYPEFLRDAKEPVELLYYRGAWELAYSTCVAIVGTRDPSAEGMRRAERLTRVLVRAGYTVVSGLAAGIDRAVHTTALKEGGTTIAVIGTHIGDVYPKEHRELQREIATNHLLISQVPVLRSEQQDYRMNRLFFPERNKTMSALTAATIIVEAGETSGTLTQGRAALYQGRKLFLLDSLFEKSELTWPAKFVEKGAIRVKNEDDLLSELPAPNVGGTRVVSL